MIIYQKNDSSLNIPVGLGPNVGTLDASLTPLEVDSSTVAQSITPQGDGFSSVTVNPYTVESLTVDPSTMPQAIIPENADAFSSVIVNPYSLASPSEAITSNGQYSIIASDYGADGLSRVDLDVNVQSSFNWIIEAKKGNITDVSCYSLDGLPAYRNGARGLLANSSIVNLPRFDSSYIADYGLYETFVGCHSLDCSLDISVSEIGQYGMFSCFSDTPISDVHIHAGLIREYGLQNCFNACNNLGNIVIDSSEIYQQGVTYLMGWYQGNNDVSICFSSLERAGWESLYAACVYTSSMNSLHIELPDLKYVGKMTYSPQYDDWYAGDDSEKADSALDNFASISAVRSMEFPELLYIYGNNAFSFAFNESHNLTSVSFPKLKAIHGETVMQYCFRSCENLVNVSFPVLKKAAGSNPLMGMFSDYDDYGPGSIDSSLRSVSFPALEVVNGMQHMCRNLANLETASFPALNATGTNDALNDAFKGCTSLRSIDFSSLDNDVVAVDTFMYCTSLTDASVHPGCLKGTDCWYNLLASAEYIENITLTAAVVDNLHLDWQPNLTADSVLEVLTHLDLTVSGKTVTFYTGGLTVSDDVQGSIQTAYDAAVNAGWTIDNLTIS